MGFISKVELMSALKKVVEAKKARLSVDTIGWLEGWVLHSKKEPTKKVVQELDSIQAKPKIPCTLYRGLNQDEYKSIEQMMKKKFGKTYEIGESFLLSTDRHTSWSKDKKIAKDFATKSREEGEVHKISGIIIEARIKPNDILLDLSKFKSSLSSIRKLILTEKEMIVKPSTLTVKLIRIF